MSFDLEKLKKFPALPGVYMMKDKKGSVLYVGKAKNIKQRVKQYFSKTGDGRIQIPFLLPHVESIDTLVVNSDKEALLLENTLIKKHKPRYNALLKDDKSYIALKITKDAWPAVRLIRYKGKPTKGGQYFGPYTSAHSARVTLDLINKIFPLRQCSDQEFLRRTRPCILHGMGRCIAPCVQKCTHEEYDMYVQKTIQFLKGQNTQVLDDLYKQMEKASENLEFEKAGAILNSIKEIEKTIEVQKVDKPLGGDLDAWGIFRQSDEVVLIKLIFREGKLVGSEPFSFPKNAQNDRELFSSFLLQHYEKESKPKEILVPCFLEDHEIISEVLSQEEKAKIHILWPQKGDKKAYVKMANQNAKAFFEKEKNETIFMENILLEMQESFHLNKYPERMECFDNSHFSGGEPVSCLIAFTDGKKETKRYRKYKLVASSASDDYGAFYEVLTRRLKRGKEENDLPDLLLIDGGKGQMNVALKVLENLNIISVDVIGIAKEEGRHDKGLSNEKIYLKGRKDPLILNKFSKILFFLQKVRDEAHRFTLGYQKQRRGKKIITSELDQIPTIGPSKKKALLSYFGSVKRIKEASIEEWKKVKGIHQKNIQEMKKIFNR